MVRQGIPALPGTGLGCRRNGAPSTKANQFNQPVSFRDCGTSSANPTPVIELPIVAARGGRNRGLPGMIVSGAEFAASDASRRRYDAVVIGGGTVGILLTASLVRRGLRVCIVEAGDAVARHPTGIFAAQSTGKTHAGVTLGRGLGLGGTSTLWGGQLAMFAPDDLTRKGHE